MTIRPPTYALLTIVLMVASHLLIPIRLITFPGSTGLGIAFVIAGLLVATWSSKLFDKAGTPVPPDHRPTMLVITGPYKLSRNPMYLGMVVMMTGLVLCMGSLSPLVGPFLFARIMTVKFIVSEELRLESIFGSEYISYSNRVRRWI